MLRSRRPRPGTGATVRSTPRPGRPASWAELRRLTQLSFPRRFPIVQFPNLPLIIALLAGEAANFLDGTEHTYAAAAFYLALAIWAYGELVHGVNWFRHLLGLAAVILVGVQVVHALHA